MRLAACLLFAAATPAAVGATDSAFTSSTARTATLAAEPDWTPPRVIASVAQKAEGGSPGFVRPGSAYHVFAAVQDSGNPPSGVASARADVSAVTSGASSAALAAGTYTAFGAAYDRRTATIYTAGSTLTDGQRTYTVTVADGVGLTSTSTGHTITIDGRQPTGTNFGAGNRGTTVGRLEQGDIMPFDYDEPMDPSSIVSGWTGTGSATVLVQIVNDDPANGGRDSLRICRAGASGSPCTPTAGMGYVDLASAGWVTANRTFTGSTLTQVDTRLTLTLGTPNVTGGFGTVTGTNMTWYPEAGAYDRAGNVARTTTWTEGLADDDF